MNRNIDRIGIQKVDSELFPFDAFEWDNINKATNPVLQLKEPWRFGYKTSFLTASDTYTISSNERYVYLTFTRASTAKVITLPSAATNPGQQITIEVTGSEAGNVSLAGDAINGITAVSWIWSGTGRLHLISNGTTYSTTSEGTWDSGTIANSGVNINRRFHKFIDKRIWLRGEVNNGTYDRSTATGALYRTAELTAGLGYTVITNLYTPIMFGNDANVGGTYYCTGDRTTAQFDYFEISSVSDAAAAYDHHWEVTDFWVA